MVRAFKATATVPVQAVLMRAVDAITMHSHGTGSRAFLYYRAGVILMPSTSKLVATRAILLCLVVAPILIFLPSYLNAHVGTPVTTVSWVSWNGNQDPRHEVYVGWETARPAHGTVRFGTDPANLAASVVTASPARINIVNLTGLSPDTVYHYRVEVNNATHATGSFRTAPGAHVPFTFGVYGDPQPKFGPGWHRRTSQVLAARNLSFVAIVGDFTEKGRDFEYNEFFEAAKPYLATTPIVPVEGNHDKPRDGRYMFAEYFPNTVDVETNLNEHDEFKQFYYSFNWSSVHVQVLHFPEIDLDDFGEEDLVNTRDYNRAFTPDHLAWIEQDLENARDMPFRVSLFHCPMSGAGFYGNNHVLKAELLPLLHRYNVTATVHGHAHHYSRSILVNETSGASLTHFVVGTGGGLADVGLRPQPETVVMAASPIFLEAHATATTLTFTALTMDGAVVDTITFTHGG